MSIVKFIEILSKKFKYLIILPIISAVITYVLVKDIPKQYTSDTTIYTGITSNSGLDVSSSKVDKIMTQNEYNNIMSILKSNSLFEEISLRLLAQHLSISKPTPEIISKESYQKTQNIITPDIKKLIVKGDEEKTYQNLTNYNKPDEKNQIYVLLNSLHPFYSTSSISSLKGEQVNSSDIFRLSYHSSDPGICYNTVKFAADIFIRDYAAIKKNLKNSAVKYFQNKLIDVSTKLDEAEDKLLKFNVENDVINYYEQTKQVTVQHEEIELNIQTQKMNYEASIAVLKKIEDEISHRYTINLKNVNILNIRSQLVDCNNQISLYEVNPEKYINTNISELRNSKVVLERKLALCLDSIQSMESTPQAIESQRILGEWLDAVKKLETNKAMYKSVQTRLAEFMSQYKKYAPLGASITKIEREISVYESEYLEILHDLNIALQNEQNINIVSNMSTIDDAKFPISAEPSKKKLYIIIAVLLTLILYIAGVFIVELMDNRLKTPALLKAVTGLEPIGAFSIENNKKIINSHIIKEKAASFIFEKISSLSVGHDKPFIIQIFSIWDDAGKTFVAETIVQSLVQHGFTADLINLMKIISEIDKENNSETPEIIKRYYKAFDYQGFVGESYIHNDYIVIVIPPISKGIDNSILIKKADINLVVYNSDLTWTSADQFNNDKLKSMVDGNLFGILTSALPENLEEMYGDIPKKRSKFRIIIKKVLKRFVS